jgi:hypothetical protein
MFSSRTSKKHPYPFLGSLFFSYKCVFHLKNAKTQVLYKCQSPKIVNVLGALCLKTTKI